MIRVMLRDYVPPSKRGGVDHSKKERDLAGEHIRRFQQWQVATEFRTLYTVGARVWIQHPELVWEGAEVTEDFTSKILKVRTEDGTVQTITVSSDESLPPLRNPDILIGENDLTSLSYLHEPAVLYNLQVRFCRQLTIYTYCGIVLVAINPYSELDIYGPDTVWAYRGQAMGDLEPHIFAVAEEAYTELERESRDQSIIVSGESGAGKTVSAKYAMRYFATVGGSATETQVEKKVLASSPIMEAIGNAKTTRNDNSSRFGKFIEIHFNKSYHIQGASMRTYLLEKSRVVFQAPGERNYHIFYQLCASRDQMPHLHLAHQDSFRYLEQGDSPDIAGVDDASTFAETASALTLLGFTDAERSDMCRIWAAVLHLGNVAVEEAEAESGDEAEGSFIPANDKHLAAFAELLELNPNEMREWLCQRKITSMREVFFKPMNTQEAMGARDALSKHIYAELFNWIVSVVNQALESGTKAHSFIGVLDIYGFETFETNSFEQFCINYANEKLQQQFNQHVFKLEQEEYLKEEIEWKLIDFYDNQPCIDLIETKLGILDLLDEECRMPKGSDASWTEKLYAKCGTFKHFARPRFGNTAFVIHHFADNVTYQSNGFLEKNRDTVLEDQINVIRSGKNKLLQRLFSDEASKLKVPVPKERTSVKVKVTPSRTPSSAGSAKQNKKTVGSQFGDSLNALMGTLNATTPHYVRCIKPNDDKTPFEYNPMRAVQQLRACGVLETIRISAAGFPSRWTYSEFFHRYRVLCHSKDIMRNNMKDTCQRILSKIIKAEDKYQFGKTKIFFRAGQVAYLEKLRAERLRACCIIIQKQVRMFVCCKKYRRVVSATRCMQRYARGFVGRRRVYHIRRTRAATTMQRHVRGWLARTAYRRSRLATIGLQARCRGYLARKRFMHMKYNAKAIIIQRYARGMLARRQYQRSLRCIVIAQSAVRRWSARRQFKQLRTEARSVEHVKKLNKGLENKIMSLQYKIEELSKENNSLKPVQLEVVDLRTKLAPMKSLEAELRRVTALLSERDAEAAELKEALTRETAEKVDLVTEKDAKEREQAALMAALTAENVNAKAQLDALNAKICENELGAEQALHARVKKEKEILIEEHDQDRDAYQKLLTEYNMLEHRYDGLERELTRLQRDATGGAGSKHRRTPSDTSTVSATSEFPDDDFGYGSVRSGSSATSRQPLDNIDWKTERSSPEAGQPDIGLVLKLQHKLAELERQRDRLQTTVDRLEKDSPTDYVTKAEDGFRLQELEIENSQLKIDLEGLRSAITTGDTGGPLLLSQFEVLQEELERRREECIQLHSVLANQTQGLKNVASNNYGSKIDMINEDGELVMAFEAQKAINRQLEDELQAETARFKAELAEFRAELDRVKADNERQQRLLSGNLTKTPASQAEAYMQHEITRLTSDNLDLQEKYDNLSELCRKLKKQIRQLTKTLKDNGLANTSTDTPNNDPSILSPNQRSELAVVRKKEREYQGMFEYRKEDEQLIIRHLIHDLKPRLAITLLPGLPAYILFMCIRHTDVTNDDNKVRSLLTLTINTVKRVLRKRQGDLDTTILWLSNTLRLLHNLKQYSGDKTFQTENTPKQNEQCLRNFDLSEYRQVLSDVAITIYQSLISTLEDAVQPMVVPAILEHEAIAGLSGQKPSGMRGRAASVSQEARSPGSTELHELDLLLAQLSSAHKTLCFHGVDPELISQLFKQIFYFICASSLNNLLLRKDLCHWSKGMQIRYNLSHLEQWARDHYLQDSDIVKTMLPIIQASQLLQARKSTEDAQSICDMCDQMSKMQIIKVLHLYTPADEFEERVSVQFIRAIQTILEKRVSPTSLLMDTRQSFPVRFPFNPSNIRLEDVEIPESLNLPMLKKL